MTTATLQQLLRTVQMQQDDLQATTRALLAEIDALLGERQAIAETLANFYRAELSMSSVQPVLTLAERLTPGLRGGR